MHASLRTTRSENEWKQTTFMEITKQTHGRERNHGTDVIGDTGSLPVRSLVYGGVSSFYINAFFLFCFDSSNLISVCYLSKMVYCCNVDCDNDLRKNKNGVSFYRFPTKQYRRQWLQNVGRGENLLKLLKHTKLRSAYFAKKNKWKGRLKPVLFLYGVEL